MSNQKAVQTSARSLVFHRSSATSFAPSMYVCAQPGSRSQGEHLLMTVTQAQYIRSKRQVSISICKGLGSAVPEYFTYAHRDGLCACRLLAERGAKFPQNLVQCGWGCVLMRVRRGSILLLARGAQSVEMLRTCVKCRPSSIIDAQVSAMVIIEI